MDTVDHVDGLTMGGSKAGMSVDDAEAPSSSSSSNTSPSSESSNEDCFMNNTTQPCPPPPRKRTRTEVSAIQNALTTDQDLGLLQYFKQSTKKEHLEMIFKNRQEWQERMESEQWKWNMESISAMLAKREHAKNRKREQWERNKQSEISKGIRSPGGTKRKV